jgi:hypothetical protein
MAVHAAKVRTRRGVLGEVAVLMKRRIIIGVLVAWAIWALALAAWYDSRTGPGLLRSLPNPVANSVSIAAIPIAVGGWFIVWGDAGPPYPWLDNFWFNVVATLVIYGVLGGLAGYGIALRRLRVRTLLIVVTLAAVGLGVLVWVVEET